MKEEYCEWQGRPAFKREGYELGKEMCSKQLLLARKVFLETIDLLRGMAYGEEEHKVPVENCPECNGTGVMQAESYHNGDLYNTDCYCMTIYKGLSPENLDKAIQNLQELKAKLLEPSCNKIRSATELLQNYSAMAAPVQTK